MRKFYELVLFAFVGGFACVVFAGEADSGDFFAGEDIHLAATRMGVYPGVGGQVDEQIVVFDEKFSLETSGNLLSSDRAVVWITTKRFEYRGGESVDYAVRAYLEGNVRVLQRVSRKSRDDEEAIIEQGKSLVVHFFVSGEVFATAESSVDGEVGELEGLGVYKNASKALRPLSQPRFEVSSGAIVPRFKNEISVVDEKFGKRFKNPLRASDYFEIGDVEEAMGPAVAVEFAPDSGAVVSNVTAATGDTGGAADSGSGGEVEFRYPINISGLWDQEPEIRITEVDGSKVATLMGRFYLWQKKDEHGDIIEFQADNGVIFYSDGEFDKGNDDGKTVTKTEVDAVYFSGNIVMTEGDRTIRAEEIYYDFVKKQSLAVKAEMRKFDTVRGIPVYIRAAKLQQVSENIFQAENIVLTTSEFYVPQISLTASQLVMTDLTGVEQRGKGISEDSKYDAILSGVEMKAGKTTIFAWPTFRTDFERPDVPIRRANIGHDSDFGTVVETQWYLSRLLGLKEPEGVDSSLMVDYFGDRGNGAGVTIDYVRDDYYGGVSSYIIKDRGTDDLGRTRQNEPVEADVRGRFTSRHRHYLPYNWQATLETSYISDKNFLESFFRTEFNTSKAQETLLYLKRLEDFWAFSLLTKVRINDFESELEEVPTAELHFKGVSFWDDLMTYYGDTRVSRLRDRYPDDQERASRGFYTFLTTRHEVDIPMRWGAVNVVPFAGGSYSIDDQNGFKKNIDNSLSDTPEEKALLGEAGVRVSTLFWKEDGTFKSELWDVDGLRHIVQPHFEAVGYNGDSDVIEMRNFMNFGLSQRWQTRRGPVDKRRSLDWMKLDVDATFLSDAEDFSISPSLPSASYGPAKFIWNDPSIPVFTRRDDTLYGMVRNSVNAEYLWRMSDTLVILSDMNYDTESGVVQQFNVGVARYVYPDISYYLGSRYFRPVIIDVPPTLEHPDNDVFEQGSNSVIGSITYALNNRYTVIVSEEYNLDYGKNVRTEFALLRRYHRLYCGLTLSIDESREENSIMFSVWPQGIKDLTFGDRRYASFRDGILED